jgi:hypothetical protein
MITEGLLMYLPGKTVQALAAEASNRTVIRHWISDITTTAFSRVLGAGADTTVSIRHVQAPDHLEGEQILQTILGSSWAIASKRSYITDVEFVQERVRRPDVGRIRHQPSGRHTYTWPGLSRVFGPLTFPRFPYMTTSADEFQSLAKAGREDFLR